MVLVRTLREKRGLRQLDVARAIGSTVQFVSNIEREMTDVPPKKMKNLAKVLGCSLEDLIKNEVKIFEKWLRHEVET